ncbi:hypothetical protein MAFF212519_01590 [Clavibacter michiganensis]
MPVTLTEIPLPAASPDASPGLHGVLAVPEGEGPWPAVVVVHEAFGVTDVMRRQAERLAEAGFLALMPDLFSAGARAAAWSRPSARSRRGRAGRSSTSSPLAARSSPAPTARAASASSASAWAAGSPSRRPPAASTHRA